MHIDEKTQLVVSGNLPFATAASTGLTLDWQNPCLVQRVQIKRQVLSVQKHACASGLVTSTSLTAGTFKLNSGSHRADL